MTTRAELWAAVYRRKAEHAAGEPYTTPPWEYPPCPACGGDGSQMEMRPGCCGRYLRSGECCGEAVPVQELVPCERCGGSGRSALTPRAARAAPAWDVHTCHAACPCHTGGRPLSDFVELDDNDAASRAAERTHLMDPDITAEERRVERFQFIRGLRSLADLLQDRPDAPLPPNDFVRHFNNADDFDAAAHVIGGVMTASVSGYEHCTRSFGPIRYGVQTDGRKAQQVKRREEAIAQRERELGLGTQDIEQAA